jgi:hypothetical protein
MKKSKLTGLLLLPVVVLPIALSLSSCADLSNSLYDVSNARNGEITHDSNLVDLKISNASLHSLLWGDKNFHNGNYVVFVTHSYHDEAS